MFRGYPEIIAAKLNMWQRGSLIRYYYDGWNRYLSDSQVQEYRSRFGIDPADRDEGIKVYFDQDGFLHIGNCHDPELEIYLEWKMEGWYHYAEKYYSLCHYSDGKILDFIRPYTKELKPGSYRTEYAGTVFDFDEDYMAFLKKFGYLVFDYNTGRYRICTGSSQLDKILSGIIEDTQGKVVQNIFCFE